MATILVRLSSFDEFFGEFGDKMFDYVFSGFETLEPLFKEVRELLEYFGKRTTLSSFTSRTTIGIYIRKVFHRIISFYFDFGVQMKTQLLLTYCLTLMR